MVRINEAYKFTDEGNGFSPWSDFRLKINVAVERHMDWSGNKKGKYN